jgi:G:T-mismatch repair DNA endonuclease (very short patch repair protein)
MSVPDVGTRGNGKSRSAEISKPLFETSGSGPTNCSAHPPRPRLPREVPTFNTLTQDDEPPTAVASLSPPDFVDSKYQRTAGDDTPGTFCPDWVVRVTGSNKAELLVLSQVAYWFARSKKGRLKVRRQHNGRWWLYKTYRQLARDLRHVLTSDEVRWAVRTLETKGVLISDYDSARSPPKLYRIDPVVVGRLCEAAERRADGG